MESIRFPSRRSVVHSTKGVAAATQPLAAAAAVKILEKGGNAAEAAVAMAATMGLVEPMMTGIGGDVFVLYYNAKTKKVEGLNGSGKSAKSLTFDKVEKHLVDGKLPPSSPLAVNVPGAAAAWIDIIDKWGNGKLSLLEVLKPAIELARDGYPVSSIAHRMWSNALTKLKNASPNGGELLIDGQVPEHGQVFTNPALAEVYERLARYGKDGYYTGVTAEAIVDVIQSLGGELTLEDLKTHSSLWLEPISVPVDDQVQLHELPPNNHGIVALLALNTLNQLDKDGKINLKSLEHNSPEYVHALVETLKYAFKDADHYVGDPDQLDYDIKDLLSDKFTESRAKLFSPDKATFGFDHGIIEPGQRSDTSYFTVADSEGNACSIIASLYQGFGSGIVPKGLGFALHNRGLNFNLRKGSRNAFGGGKRPYHTIIPAMLTRGDDLFAAYGVMGGFMQPQGHIQVAFNLRLFGLDPQEALDAPRVCISPDPDDGDIPSTEGIIVNLEEGFSEETAKALEKLGHKVKIVKGTQRGLFGRGQVIVKDTQRGKLVYHAGSDLRGDGAAIPQV